MTKKEKKLAYQTIVVLKALKEESKRDYLKKEADRLITELEKSLD